MHNQRAIRMTRQRRVIMEELQKVHCHPTADQVYELVRKRLPRISLATVYRNLDVLSESGAILKLEMGCSQRRYDGDISPHYHVRCVKCGKVGDVFAPPIRIPDVGPVEDFSVEGHRVEFFGVCDDCSDKKEHRLDS